MTIVFKTSKLQEEFLGIKAGILSTCKNEMEECVKYSVNKTMIFIFCIAVAAISCVAGLLVLVPSFFGACFTSMFHRFLYSIIFLCAGCAFIWLARFCTEAGGVDFNLRQSRKKINSYLKHLERCGDIQAVASWIPAERKDGEDCLAYLIPSVEEKLTSLNSLLAYNKLKNACIVSCTKQFQWAHFTIADSRGKEQEVVLPVDVPDALFKRNKSVCQPETADKIVLEFIDGKCLITDGVFR